MLASSATRVVAPDRLGRVCQLVFWTNEPHVRVWTAGEVWFTRSAASAIALLWLLQSSFHDLIIAPDLLDVPRINPGPRPEFRARSDRLLPLRSIDEVAGDNWSSWRGC